MPRGDRTGPYGDGPMTGRRMGFCTGHSHPGFENNFAGYGSRYGRGFGYGARHNTGFGYGHGNYYDERFSNVSEKTIIENEMRILKDQLSGLEKRLSDMNEKSDSKE